MKANLFHLQNGMQVVLEENSSKPVLSLNALVKVGSADETDKEAGISHLIEHMLFKGTANRKVGEIAKDVESAGGDINAYTSFDQTVFYINMAKRFADKGLDILADAVQNPTFDATELKREKEVILEEIRRERDNPGRYVGEILFSKAYKKHTYGRPIIGFDKTVKAIDQKYLFQFYRRWYTPENTVLVVVGDFKTDDLLKKIERAFSSFKNSNWNRVTTPRLEEPPQTRPLFAVHSDNIQSVHYALAFHVPQITHEDIPAIDVLTHILGGAQSSRLHQVLKEKKHLVQSIACFAYAPKDPGLMIIGGQLNAPKAPFAFQGLMEEIEKIKEEGPTPRELIRTKLNIKASEIYEKETVGGEAGKLAYFLATAGKLDFEHQYQERVQAVQKEDVQEIAARYLMQNKMTTALLVPRGELNKTWEKRARESLLKSPAKVKRKLKPVINRKEPFLKQFSNGVRLILKEDRTLPIVSVCAASLGGLLGETPQTNGIYSLMAHCITKGTQKKTALQIAKSIEAFAGDLSGFTGRNTYGLKSSFLSDYLQGGLDLFFEVLMEPLWDLREVAKEKKLLLEMIKNQEDALSSLAFYHFQRTLYPTHPYGMRGLGSKKSIPRLNPALLRKYHQRHLAGDNLVLSVVGDFASSEMIDRIDEKIHRFPKRGRSLETVKCDPKPESIQEVITRKQKEQAHIVLGFRGSTIRDKDHYPMTVLNSILAGMGGRLFLNLRDKQSLAYSVTSMLFEGVDPGYFAVYIGTEPSKIDKALEGIKGELKKILNHPVPAEELKRTQNYLVGVYELELQKNSSLSQAYAFNELYHLGFQELHRYPEKILGVTSRDILRVARKYIDLNSYVLSIITRDEPGAKN